MRIKSAPQGAFIKPPAMRVVADYRGRQAPAHLRLSRPSQRILRQGRGRSGDSGRRTARLVAAGEGGDHWGQT